MRKYKLLSILLIVLIVVSACSSSEGKKEDVLHLGVNCEIVDIDLENQTMIVKGIEEVDQKVFGIPSNIDCSKADLITFKNGTEPEFIDLEEFKISDSVAIDIFESEIEKIGQKDMPKVKQIQLLKREQ